jgi:alpha-1,2-mannosyltransferase
MKINDTPAMSRLKGRASFIIACLFFIMAIMINMLPFLDGKSDLMDFGSFYASGLKIQSGENPYDPNSEYIFEINFSRVGAGGKMMNLNPPISVVLFRSLAQFDPHQTLIIWQVISAVLYAGSIILLGTTYKQNIGPAIFPWAFTLAGFWHTLVLGQIYVVLLLITAVGWILLRRGQYIPAGVVIGLVVAIKPNFIIWPIFLLFAGYFVTFFISILSSLIVSLIPVAFYGTGIYVQWLEASTLHPETIIMPGNNSMLGLTARFGSIPAGIVISIILVLILLIWSKLKISSSIEKPEYVCALGIIASLLASPISWTGYTILLLPIFFSLKKWTVPAMISAAILSVPFQLVLQFFQTSFLNFVLFGWFYGWGILFLLAALTMNTTQTPSMQVLREEISS